RAAAASRAQEFRASICPASGRAPGRQTNLVEATSAGNGGQRRANALERVLEAKVPSNAPAGIAFVMTFSWPLGPSRPGELGHRADWRHGSVVARERVGMLLARCVGANRGPNGGCLRGRYIAEVSGGDYRQFVGSASLHCPVRPASVAWVSSSTQCSWENEAIYLIFLG